MSLADVPKHNFISVATLAGCGETSIPTFPLDACVPLFQNADVKVATENRGRCCLLEYRQIISTPQVARPMLLLPARRRI